MKFDLNALFHYVFEQLFTTGSDKSVENAEKPQILPFTTSVQMVPIIAKFTMLKAVKSTPPLTAHPPVMKKMTAMYAQNVPSTAQNVLRVTAVQSIFLAGEA
jgi:hypothetical protein